MLGIAFGWGIPMAFAAETMEVPWAAWWLMGINTLWAVIYDTLYAMVDREDDMAVGVKSTAILFGRFDIPIIGILMGLMIILLGLPGSVPGIVLAVVPGCLHCPGSLSPGSYSVPGSGTVTPASGLS